MTARVYTEGDLSTCIHCGGEIRYADPDDPPQAWQRLVPDAFQRTWRCGGDASGTGARVGHVPAPHGTGTPDTELLKMRFAKLMHLIYLESDSGTATYRIARDALVEILGPAGWVRQFTDFEAKHGPLT